MRRQDYTVAWICAVTTEAVAALGLLDEEHASIPDQSPLDDNIYHLGRMGHHNVVILCLSALGKYGIVSAANAVNNLLRSFDRICVGLMVGTGGGAPSHKYDMRLGDVVVGCPAGNDGGVILYDFGKTIQGQDLVKTGRFNRPPIILLNALTQLKADHELHGSTIPSSIETMFHKNPKMITKYTYPGIGNDRLYQSSYIHHDLDQECSISCANISPPLIQRSPRVVDPDTPVIHYGLIATADVTMKDASLRDKLSRELDILCFEVEAAQLTDIFPSLVIRGICDYSDSHKNNRWQGYAAATAASYARELLGTVPKIYPDSIQVASQEMFKPLFTVPFERDTEFIAREKYLDQIEEQIRINRRASLYGLGGVGKSQIAIEYAYRYKGSHPKCHVLWVHAASTNTFLQAYQEIARSLKLPGFDDPEVDWGDLVFQWLQEDDNCWLMILDNADDAGIFSPRMKSDALPVAAHESRKSLRRYLPNKLNAQKAMLFTTRNRRLSEKLADGRSHIEVLPFSLQQAKELLRTKLKGVSGLFDLVHEERLVDFLGFIPLAITQAAIFINRNRYTVQGYLTIIEKDEQDMKELLSLDLQDPRRSLSYPNSVFRTWKASFDQILEQEPQTIDLLSVLAMLNPHTIPEKLLRCMFHHDVEFTWAISTLTGFALISQQAGSQSYTIHPLVRASVHYWLKQRGRKAEYASKALQLLADEFPDSQSEQIQKCESFLAHAQAVLCNDLSLTGDRLNRAKLLHKVGWFNNSQGRYDPAYHEVFEAFSIFSMQEGEDSSNAMTSLSLLASVLRSQRKYRQAEVIGREVLGLMERVLGAEHPNTLAIARELMLVSQDREKYEAAEEMNLPEEYSSGSTDPSVAVSATLGSSTSNTFPDSGYESHGRGTSLSSVDQPRSSTKFDNINKEHSDRSSVFSNDSEALNPRYREYVSELADELLTEIRQEASMLLSVERLCDVLPELLKGFALKFALRSQTHDGREIVYFARRFRTDIAKAVQERWQHAEKGTLGTLSEEDDGSSPLSADNESIQYNEPKNWMIDLDLDEKSSKEQISSTEVHVENGLMETKDVRGFGTYRATILNSTPYRWLLAMLRKEAAVGLVGPNIMDSIRQKIMSYLPRSLKVSRKTPVEVYQMTFCVDWDPIAFLMEQQYQEQPGHALASAITITGNATDAQTLTTTQYLDQTWPLSGEHLLCLLKAIVSDTSGRTHEAEFPDGTKVGIWMDGAYCMVKATGVSYSICEIGEQLAWLGGALRSSPIENGIVCCTPGVHITLPSDIDKQTSMSTKAQISCQILFNMEKHGDGGVYPTGRCWHDLFENPVVVGGFPILRRPSLNIGLEITLDFIAALASARYVTMFHGMVFLKGFCTILFPIKRIGNVLLWHLLFNGDGSHISYVDPRIRSILGRHKKIETISLFDIERERHVLGWLTNADYCIGAPGVNYIIKPSGLEYPPSGCRLEKITVSAGRIVTVATTITPSKKDTPLRLRSRDDYSGLLKWLGKKHIVLYDQNNRRAWLTDGICGLLHLVRASLESDKIDKVRANSLFNNEALQEAADPYTGVDAAVNFLSNPANKGHRLYTKNDEYYEETIQTPGGLEREPRWKHTYVCIQDRVEGIAHVLEQLISYQEESATEDGIDFRAGSPLKTLLSGFDFMDVATEEDPFHSRVADIEPEGTGWVNLVEKLHAVTLFGCGFGELIRPVEGSEICQPWKLMPTGKDYLAVSVSQLKEIMDKSGDMLSNPPRVAGNIYWYSQNKTFEPCQCDQRKEGENCNRIQDLHTEKLIDKAFKTKTYQSPADLADGALIFGHSGSLSLYWKGKRGGGLKIEKTSSASPPPESDNSGIASNSAQVFTDAAVISSRTDTDDHATEVPPPESHSAATPAPQEVSDPLKSSRKRFIDKSRNTWQSIKGTLLSKSR